MVGHIKKLQSDGLQSTAVEYVGWFSFIVARKNLSFDKV